MVAGALQLSLSLPRSLLHFVSNCFLILNLPSLSLHLYPPTPLHLSRQAPFSLNGVLTFGTFWTEERL